MINYFVKLHFVKNSFLISCDNIDIKDDGDVYFMLNGVCISVIGIDDVYCIYHYLNGNFANKVYYYDSELYNN